MSVDPDPDPSVQLFQSPLMEILPYSERRESAWAALAFLLGAEKGIFALIAGMLTGVIVMFIVRKIRKETNKEPFALVPFLSFGAMLAFMI